MTCIKNRFNPLHRERYISGTNLSSKDTFSPGVIGNTSSLPPKHENAYFIPIWSIYVLLSQNRYSSDMVPSFQMPIVAIGIRNFLPVG